ncbi:helix-turn-helix domain-containing protein [Paenibacillus sp. MMO-58]|uniref:helix-turn-helix domain-containing protein n=1 Tax=Paenibacillus sp. MMO-58 TaxID=3081290 RepID=UPI00301A22EC
MISQSLEEMLYYNIGSRIKTIRLARGLTQLEFSKRINLSRPSVSNIENGIQKVSLISLFQIGMALNVSIYDLLPESVGRINKNRNKDDDTERKLTLRGMLIEDKQVDDRSTYWNPLMVKADNS